MTNRKSYVDAPDHIGDLLGYATGRRRTRHHIEPPVSIYLRVPMSLKRRVESAAKEAGLSVNEWLYQHLNSSC